MTSKQPQTPSELFKTNLAAGSKIWVEDNSLAWVQAEVVEADSQNVTARLERGKKLVVTPVSKVHLREVDPVPGGVDDMTQLAYLHEPGVLHNLASRYENNSIYTYTGNILIAVNPFTRLPLLYDPHMMDRYRGAPFGALSPHIFAIAESSYRAMINEGQNQAILVSGESGAGKTETTKLIMKYLAHVGGRVASHGRRTVEQQVLESNPLLEAFGNAKTVRNDNSSRFGKFVGIQFDSTGRISGAAIRTYLLERSRVVKIMCPERNYHCFYQLCAAPEAAKHFKLTSPKDFYYLNQSSCFTLSGVDELKEYYKTRRAMDIVGINLDDQDAIFRTLAAILHIGNVEFDPGEEHDSSVVKDDRSVTHLQIAANLLMCDTNLLKKTLCTRVILTGGETILKMLDPEAAIANRDALTKTIYSHLFDWLVQKINISIGQDPKAKAQIGVLDIYGFESFVINSFEQFCINFANEKLQQHFNEHVLRMEQEEYAKEAIDWSYIDFIDNQDVLDLIEKRPMGIIALLDEACLFPKSTNETFVTKLFETYRSHGRLSKPKLSSTEFIISHYAGEVNYQTDLFLDKNRDYVVVEHKDLLLSSRDPFVSSLFKPQADDGIKSCYKFSSVATRFKQQLQSLVETLNTTEPHYVRCVKPNSDNKAQQFINQNVIHQLRCGGVLEAIRISCAGYPTRRTYGDFLRRYGLLAPDVIEGRNNGRAKTENLLKKMSIQDYQLGLSKVFLRVGQMAVLDARRAEILNKAVKVIQRQYRSFLSRKTFISLRRAAIRIQAHWRGYVTRKLYQLKRHKAAAILIQKEVRMWRSRRRLQNFRQAAIIIQRHFRTLLSQRQKQSAMRANAVGKIQAAQETETRYLQEAKCKLEKQCEELTWHLQVERQLRAETDELKRMELQRLQSSLIDMQQQVETMGMLMLNERETNKMLTIQLASLIKTQPLFEALKAKNYKLTKENGRLKILLDIQERKTLEAQTELVTTRRESEERLYKSKEIESSMDQVYHALQRLDEKMLNMERENHDLRKATPLLVHCPDKAAVFKSLSIFLLGILRPRRILFSDGLFGSQVDVHHRTFHCL